MQIAVPVLLVIILSIVIVMVVLIIFQGETNRKVEKLSKETYKLNSKLTRDERNKERKITKNHNHGRSYRHSQNSEHKSLQTEEQQENLRNQIQKQSKIPEKIEEITGKIKESKYWSEDFLGESIINKVGIVILALGIAFFVKFAIESTWLNNIGRVSVGVLSGGLLIVLAHFLHKNYRAFSSVILGGGMSVLYYTVAIAYDEYQLISEITSFILILTITSFTVSLSIAYNRIELAFLATLAAFTAPLLVRFNFDSHLILFSYLLIINTGILILVYFKKWLILDMMAFYGTMTFIAAWFLLLYFNEKPIPHLASFLFLTAYYILFFIMHIVSNIKHKEKLKPIQFTMVFVVNGMYYTGVMIIIRNSVPEYDGLFTAMMGVFNFIYFIILFKRKGIDKNLLNLLLGLVILFITLVPPVQVVGKTITLVWSIQMVLLLWLSQKIDFNLMRLTSITLLFLMIGSLVLDMWSIYISASTLSNPLPLLLNKGFIINIFASITLGLYSFFLGHHKRRLFIFIPVKILRIVVAAFALIAFYFALFLEIRYQVTQNVNYKNSINIFLGIYNFAFLSLASIPALFVSKSKLNMLSWYVGFFAFFIYIFFYHSIFIDVRDSYLLQTGAKYSAYISHYIIIFILILISFISLRSAVICKEIKSKMAIFSLWSSVFVFLFVFSSELDSIYLINNFKHGFVLSDYISKVHTLPYTLLWGGFSFLLISLGMLIHFKGLRDIALVLFLITIIKMFVFDLTQITKGEQVIEFLFMGIILLIASFLYHQSKFRSGVKITS